MTLGFAESMPESNDVVYHVEWLESQQVFPSLSSTIGDGDGHNAATDSTEDEWQFLQRQEILQAQEDFPADGGHHQLKTCEMEGTWQQVDVLREKQFVDVAAEATDLPQPSKKAPTKPQRHHSLAPLTDEQQRHFYWEMIDRLDEQEAMNGGGGGDFYDLYYDRKTHSNHKNNNKYYRRHHMELLQRWHHRFEVGDLWANGKKIQRVIDHVHKQQQQRQQSSSVDHLTNGKVAWGRLPTMNPRLIHSLVMPRHHHHIDRSSTGSVPGSKVFKSLMEPDFCLQVKNG